jgi:hypothetical protein
MKIMLKSSTENAPALLRNTKWLQSYYAAIAGFFLPMHSALACISEEDSFNSPAFLILSTIMLFIVAMFSFLAWLIKKLFFQQFFRFSTIFALSFLLSLGLGAFGTFAIPQFELVYASFGVDLPSGTEILFSFRQFLWLPFILIIVLYYSTRDNPNKTRYFAVALLIEAGLSILTGSLISLNIGKIVAI